MNTVRGSVIDQDTWNAAWTPVFSTDIGAAAASFTGGGSVTTATARAKKNGKTGLISINFNALTLAVTPAYIQVTLPTGWVPQSSNPLTPAVIKLGGTWETGQVAFLTTGVLRFYRANQAVFTASTTFQCSVQSILEIN